MPDDTTPDPTRRPDAPPDLGAGLPPWNPRQALRDRAAATRKIRDEAIAELRATRSDEELLEQFGIDLPEIER